MSVTFSNRLSDGRKSIIDTHTAYVEIYIYNENFPYSRTASIRLQEKEVESLLNALDEVPFSLLADQAKKKKEEVKNIYK